MNGLAEICKPVFIVGMNGSGTTMLLDCLDNHPELFGFIRETKVIPYFIKSSGKYGDLSQDDNFYKMWDDFRSISFFKYVNNGIEVPVPENWRDAPRNVAGVIDGTFRYFAEKDGKSRWCEKSPMYAQHIRLLADVFPGSKFIHIIRDGRACAASFHRRWSHTPDLTVYRWKHIVQDAQRQGATIPDRYFELRYEDLTDAPEEWLRRICEFLDVPYNPCVVSLSRVHKHSGSTHSTITRREEYWRDYFSQKKLISLDRIAGNVLCGLGYESDSPEGDTDPNIFLVKFWMYRDATRLVLQAMRQELTRGKRGGKWDNLSGRILSAIRQRFTNRL